jgi:hypothetical protein
MPDFDHYQPSLRSVHARAARGNRFQAGGAMPLAGGAHTPPNGPAL